MSVKINGLTGIELPDNAHIGSTSDTDSIKFPANGSVEFTQTAKFKDSIFMGTGDIANGGKLADYEAGSFLPTIQGADGASGQTYATQSGNYIRIGDIVYCQGRVTLTNKGTLSGSNAAIGNLPFIANSSGSRSGNWNFNSWSNISGSTYSIKSYIGNDVNLIYLIEDTGATGTAVSKQDITNTSHIDFAGTYYTDA